MDLYSITLQCIYLCHLNLSSRVFHVLQLNTWITEMTSLTAVILAHRSNLPAWSTSLFYFWTFLFHTNKSKSVPGIFNSICIRPNTMSFQTVCQHLQKHHKAFFFSCTFSYITSNCFSLPQLFKWPVCIVSHSLSPVTRLLFRPTWVDAFSWTPLWSNTQQPDLRTISAAENGLQMLVTGAL